MCVLLCLDRGSRAAVARACAAEWHVMHVTGQDVALICAHTKSILRVDGSLFWLKYSDNSTYSDTRAMLYQRVRFSVGNALQV